MRTVQIISLLAMVACGSPGDGDELGDESDGVTDVDATDSETGSTGSETDTDSTTDSGDTDGTSSDDTSESDTETGTTTGDPGELLGVFDITYYWVTYEGDFDPPADTEIGTCGGAPLATVPAEFANALALEGTGKLLDERIINVGGCGCGGGYDCFVELDPLRFPWGQGSQGNALVPFHSVATDTDVLAFGTSLYAPALDGVALPDGGTHDGCLIAADVGGGINGMHIDWFVGLYGNYQTLDPEVPETLELFEGGTLCP